MNDSQAQNVEEPDSRKQNRRKQQIRLVNDGTHRQTEVGHARAATLGDMRDAAYVGLGVDRHQLESATAEREACREYARYRDALVTYNPSTASQKERCG